MPRVKKWKKISARTIIAHKLFRVETHRVKTATGKIIPDWLYISGNGGVMVVPVTRDNNVLLLDHYKYAANRNVLVLPGGGLESKKEKPARAALRELREETGYTSARVSYLGSMFTDPTNVAIKTAVFLALDCQQAGEQHLDVGEEASVKKVSVAKLFSLLRTDKIQDGPTLAALALAYEHLKKLHLKP